MTRRGTTTPRWILTMTTPSPPHGDNIVQYSGYTVGTVVKQADTVLAGYPLMYPMAASTRAQVTMSTRVLVTCHVSRVRTSPRTRRPRTRAAPP